MLKSITENFLAPIHFPWHSRAKLPQKIVKTIPRDIDDLAVITHCLDELHAPFGDFCGPFGFGRYENGQSKGNYSNAALVETTPNSGSKGFASARRSLDPGAIELNVRLPSFLIDAIAPKSEGAQAQASDATRKAELSRLPFNWRKKDGYPQFTYRNVDRSACANAHFKDGDIESLKLAEIRSRSCAHIALAKSYMRKWRISMKIGGVSSRTTLFPPSTVKLIDPKDDRVKEHSRIVFRPMLCIAILPQAIQSGLTVSLEKASEMDNDGLARSLGSYDCRFTEALLSNKKDVSNRLKRIEVGRTRLVWSNIPGDEPFLPSIRNRVNFNSLITGRRIDVSKCKRPREVKVGVRLNGRLITEEAIEDLPSATNGNARRKRKHSLRQAEIEVPSLKPSVEPPDSRTDAEIDAALRIFDDKSSANESVIYLEMGKGAFCDSNIDRNTIIASLLKCNLKKSANKKPKRSASNDTISIEAARMFGGGQVVMKSNTPRFACVPLEDGLMRTICLNAGNMTGSSAHLVLRGLMEEESKHRCSICGSDEGTGKDGVQECVDCHLLAHSSCCFDRGQYSSNFSDTRPLNPPHEVNSAAYTSNGNLQGATECFDARAEQWKCAVCCHYTKPPSRYAHLEMNAVSNRSKQHTVASRSGANVPGPQCFLCPHRGGAMSLLDSSQGADHNHQTWIHEVCRIWSRRDVFDISTKSDCSSIFSRHSNGSPLVNVCALCGTGGMSDGGLTRCAASGCLVAFHPMCALLASKLNASNVGTNDNTTKTKSVRKTRRTENIESEMKSDDKEKIAAEQKLSLEYTLRLVKLTRAGEASTVIPVAFCGIHNPSRDGSFYGCLPCGVVT